MGVVTSNLILPPLPLSNGTSKNEQSQAFDPKKKAIFLIQSKKFNGADNLFSVTVNKLIILQ